LLDFVPWRPPLARRTHCREHLVDDVVVRVQRFGFLALKLCLLFEVLDCPLLLFDDAFFLLDFRLEIRAIRLRTAPLVVFVPLAQRSEIGIQRLCEPVELLHVEPGMFLYRHWCYVEESSGGVSVH